MGDGERVGWVYRVGPFAAIGTTPAAVMLGGGVVERLSDAFLPSIILGSLFVLLLTLLHGIRGQRSGKSFPELASEVLGPQVSRLASFVVTVLMVGWYAFAIGVAGSALSQLLRMPSYVGVLLYTVAVALLSRAGIGRWNWVAVASIVTTITFIIWSAWVLSPSAEIRSPSEVSSFPGVLMGSSLVLGYASAFALRSPDFTRDMRSRGDVLRASLIGLTIPLTAFSLFGAFLYLEFGTWDLPLLLVLAGVPLLANLFLVLGFAASSLANLFSAELAASHLTGLRKETSFVVVLVAGAVVAALGFHQLMVLWLTFLGILVPPLVITLILGQSINRGTPPVASVLAWGSGTALGLAGWFLGSELYLVLGLGPPVVILWLLRR